MQCRKLLSKFPDDRCKAGTQKKRRKPGEGSVEIAQMVRQKGRETPEELVEAEKRWLAVDKVLHPELHGAGTVGHVGLGTIQQESDGSEHDDTDSEWEEFVRREKETEAKERARAEALQEKEADLQAKLTGTNREKFDEEEANKVEERKAYERTKEVISAFKLIDRDHSGFVDKEEFDYAIKHDKEVIAFIRKSHHLKHFLRQENFQKAFDAMDNEDGDGQISLKEFITFCKEVPWECPYGADELKMIVATEESDLQDEMQIEVRQLMVRFQGEASDYAKKNYFAKQRIQHDTIHNNAKYEMDTDARCRELLKEIDVASNNSNEFMDSNKLAGGWQRYPTTVLRLELERELDRTLLTQIFEREQAMPDDDQSDSDQDVSDDDEEAIMARVERKKKKQEQIEAALQADPHLRYNMTKTVNSMQAKTPQELERAKFEKQLGKGACMACMKNPCQWRPCLDRYEILARKEVVSNELKRINEEIGGFDHKREEMSESLVPLSVMRGGSKRMIRQEIIRELGVEQKKLIRQMSLVTIDEELHTAYNSMEEYFVTKALHGYPQTQYTKKAIIALEMEENRLLARTTADELIDDILDWMLEGWYFGERISEREVSGYVPSIKASGPLTVFDLRHLEEAKARKKLEDSLGEEYKKKRTSEMMGTPFEKWEPIEAQAQEMQKERKAVREGSDLEHELGETEQNLKFGLFCLTLMYFRAMSMLKRDKDALSGKAEAIMLGEEKAERQNVNPERASMLQEEKLLKERQSAMDDAMGRAKEGAMRKIKREEAAALKLRQKLWAEQRQKKREEWGSNMIEKLYRGHLGRKAAAKWKLRKAEIDAMRALQLASAVTVQRVYRGRLGRQTAEERRVELAEFIAQIRAEEANEEEEQYWATHPMARYRRNMGNFVKKAMNRGKETQESTKMTLDF